MLSEKAQTAEPIVVSIPFSSLGHHCVRIWKIEKEIIWFCYGQGATIKTDERTGKIVIARVMHGGAADRSGLIHPGDEVIEVNGIDVLGKTPNDVLEILVSIDTFIFWRGPDSIFIFSAKCRRDHHL